MSAPLESYLTLGAPTRHEPDKIKGSRFIACLAPAATEDEAAAFIDDVRAEFADARHVCWAWRLGPPGDRTRSSDDGEPGGSAGRPILAQLEGHGVFGVVACVVRYFGGVKLGVGGLMRAYGGAAGAALDRVELARVEVLEAVDCVHPYGDSGAVQGVLAHFGVEARDAEYDAEVRFRALVPLARVVDFEAALRDATAGRAITSRA